MSKIVSGSKYFMLYTVVMPPFNLIFWGVAPLNSPRGGTFALFKGRFIF